ncbi:MAG: hypothetical protein GXP63_05340, partial [DPANN group archaeon]|nr:hypothetical protein [DPANN group archaeon]
MQNMLTPAQQAQYQKTFYTLAKYMTAQQQLTQQRRFLQDWVQNTNKTIAHNQQKQENIENILTRSDRIGQERLTKEQAQTIIESPAFKDYTSFANEITTLEKEKEKIYRLQAKKGEHDSYERLINKIEDKINTISTHRNAAEEKLDQQLLQYTTPKK